MYSTSIAPINLYHIFLFQTARPNFETDTRSCIKLFAEIQPVEGQPVSANFEVSKSYCNTIYNS